jgi:hypothetical protein
MRLQACPLPIVQPKQSVTHFSCLRESTRIHTRSRESRDAN